LEILGDFLALGSLSLTGSLVTDDVLMPLAGNKRIERVQLQGCSGLTDGSLAILAEMPNLRALQLNGTSFGPKATTEFKTKKPTCTIW
jgi:hypothetical protein